MLLNELFEGETKHVTFCFGRMNPPTIGHKQVLDTMKAQGGDMRVFVSQTQDAKKNPLDYGTKIKFIKELFPEYAKDVVDNAGLNTVVKVASYLFDQGYNAATFVAGSDRLEDMKKLLEQYNGVEGKAHGYYKFDVIDFVSSGDREDGAEGVAGVSASGAREAAANNNFEKFKTSTGAGELAKPLFAAVRKGMKITESVEEHIVKVKGGYELKSKKTGKNLGKYSSKAGAEKRERQVQYFKHAHEDISEAPIEMDPTDPMNPKIYGHEKANPSDLKTRMMRAAGQFKDIASRVDTASPGEWQLIARQFDELKMNVEQIRHALAELAKTRKKGGVRSRGIDPMLDSFKYPFAGEKKGQKAGPAGQLKGTDPKEYPKNKLVGG